MRRRLFALVVVAALGLLAAHPRPAEASLASIGYTVLRWLDRADLLHHDVTARIDPPRWKATFTDDVTFQSKGSRRLHVLLGKDARLDRITIPGTGERVAYNRSVTIGALPFHLYRIELPQAPAAGETFTLRFEWTIDASTLTFINPFLARHFFYIGYASLWHPHTPEESFFTADVTILTPQGYQAFAEGASVAPGAETATKTAAGSGGFNGLTGSNGPDGSSALDAGVEEGWAAHRYRIDVPVNGMGIGVGQYRNDYSIESDGYTVEVWRPLGLSSNAAQAGLAVSRAVRFFADRLGPPPIREFRVVEAPFPAAVSYAGLSNLVYGGDLSDAGVEGREGIALFAAHETAHKWIGGSVGVRLIGGAWLVEGLAEYLAYLALAENEGPRKARELFEQRAYEAFVQGSSRRALGSIELFDQDAEHMYAKSPMVMRMLHRRLGTDRFYAVVRSFVEAHRGMHVTGRDFESWVIRHATDEARKGEASSLAEEAGRPREWNEPLYADGAGGGLSEFFNAWIRTNRSLDYELGIDVAQGESGEAVSVTVSVTSLGQIEEPGAVDVALYFPGGTVEWVALAPGERRTLQFASPPYEARLDPDGWLADARPANNVWKIGE